MKSFNKKKLIKNFHKGNKLLRLLNIQSVPKQNEVPYISTYYIKPIVKPNEEVIIDYYITDYHHKEYINEDFSETFKVTVRIEGKEDIVINNLKAGDHSVSLGTFPNLDGQEQKFSILCTDKHGRNSHELFNFFLVRNEVPVNEYIMTEEDLATYNISNSNDTTMINNTREGLQKLLDDKKALGYNKLKLLEGTYRIDHLCPIYIPTNFTLDMNNATLKLHEFAGDSAIMMELNNTFDSHVVNGIIEGDYYNHDYTNSPNNSEWVHGISLSSSSKYSSFENLTIKDITGYGACSGASKPANTDLSLTYLYPTWLSNSFQLGDIDRNTGLDIESNDRTTCPYVNISGYRNIGYFMIGKYLGYQGNPCGTWNLICHFYDDNKNLIKSTDAYLYRRVGVPSNATYVRVTILNEDYPTDLGIQLFRTPTHCSFKNIKFDNCRCVGLAQSAMNDMLVESCEFTNCGQVSARCAYDAEDGWDMMQDATFRKLNFHDNPNNEFLTCAGHNFVIEDMIDGKIYFWPRTNSYVVRNNNNLKSASLGRDTRNYNGYVRVYNNIANGSISITGGTSQWPLIVKDCTINGRTQNDLGAGLWIRCDIGGHATSSYKYDTALGGGNYLDCYIHDKWGENQGGVYKNCRFYNIYGNLHYTFELNSCDIDKFHGFTGDTYTIFTLKDSVLNNFKIEYGYWKDGSTVLIENCNITNDDFLLKLPHYSMKQPISIVNNTISSTGSLGLVYFYDDRGETSPQNILKLESNNISLPNSQYIINGLTNTTVNNINIVALYNTYNPTSLLLCNPLALECDNISIVQQ